MILTFTICWKFKLYRRPIERTVMMPDQGVPMQAGGQQVIIVHNRSGGPKVFGIVAIILGVIGVVMGLLNFGSGADMFEGTIVAVIYVTGVLSIVSSGMFTYAGVLLFQYQKSGVWWGFGSLGIALVADLIGVFWVTAEMNAIDPDLGGFMATLGLIYVAAKVVCCSIILALPLMMNGQDLE